MQFVQSLTFTKEWENLPCEIYRLDKDDLSMVMPFQQKVYDAMPDKDLLVTLSQEEYAYLIDHGFLMGVFPEGSLKCPAYILGCIYPSDEENLGHDIGLSQEELAHVAHLEIAMADPKYRGFHMHSRMCALCTQILMNDGRTRYVMATVSPKNIPSKKAVEYAGLQVVMTKEKYGGHLRHILLKKK